MRRVSAVELKHASGLAYREATPDGEQLGDPVLCIHGFPESSFMWQRLLPALADAGRRAIAPDLPGYGDSPADPPGTWERHVEALERFRSELGIERAVLVVHDWGGLIGLRWACDHPGAASALVVSNTGFFPDGRWHGFAKGLRTAGQGEELVKQFTRDGFAAMMSSSSAGFDDEAIGEYWKAFETPEGRQGVLDLYRSGDFEKLEPYRGRLAALDRADALPLGRGRRVCARLQGPTASARRCLMRSSQWSRARGTSSTPTTQSAARRRSSPFWGESVAPSRSMIPNPRTHG